MARIVADIRVGGSCGRIYLEGISDFWIALRSDPLVASRTHGANQLQSTSFRLQDSN
jgi:hypothetical protein